jgi:predicted  nucleic acid-binding Zn-ribbon protein
VAEKLWNVEADVLPLDESDPFELERVRHEAARHRKAVVSASIERTNEKFEEEREKLIRWADDKTEAVEQELANVKAQIRALQRDARKAETVDAQKEFEEKIQRLQKKKKRIRSQIFDMEDEIEAKRNELIDALEKRMNHEVEVDSLFTIKWEVR